MHGTVEWLPGSPLGSTGLSWPDVLLGNLPNAYVSAANNPSESVIAKRRGFGTLVSYNVPPYARAGLYNKMRELRERLAEYRERGERGSSASERDAVIDCVIATGLWKDRPPSDEGDSESVRVRLAGMCDDEFEEYCKEMAAYLQEVEGRLFSEGLHVLGRNPDAGQLLQYLEGYFQGDESASGLPHEALMAVAEHAAGRDGATAEEALKAVREKLEVVHGVPVDAEVESKMSEAFEICRLLNRNSEELDGVVKVLDGT